MQIKTNMMHWNMILMTIECFVLQFSILKSTELGSLDLYPINNKIVYIQISRKYEFFSVKFCASSKAVIQGSGERIFLFTNLFIVLCLEICIKSEAYSFTLWTFWMTMTQRSEEKALLYNNTFILVYLDFPALYFIFIFLLCVRWIFINVSLVLIFITKVYIC